MADFYGGTGTEDNPFVIRTGGETTNTAVQQLMLLGTPDYVSAGYFFELGEDISLSGSEFTCIGTDSAPFVGTLDGKGYRIQSLTKKFMELGGATVTRIIFDGFTFYNEPQTFSSSGYLRCVLDSVAGDNAVSCCQFSTGARYDFMMGKTNFAGCVARVHGNSTSLSVCDCKVYIYDYMSDTKDFWTRDYAGALGVGGMTVERCYVYGSYFDTYLRINSTVYEGGVLCSVNSASTVKNCVSNFIQLGDRGDRGRIYSGSSIEAQDNYANAKCYVGGGTVSGTPEDKHGGDAAPADLSAKSWWVSTAGWTFGKGDFIHWNWDSAANEPVLNFNPVPSSSSVSVRADGEWKEGTPYVKSSERWVEADAVFVRIAGEWRESE